MAVTKFQPEVWSASLLTVLDRTLAYGSPVCVNRDYEGDVSAFGDTVHITDVADPTISDYVKDNDLTIEALTDDELTLLIDQSKSFSFQLDDIDKRQVRDGGSLMAKAAARAGAKLADAADKYIAKKMALAASNALGVVDASSTATNVYDSVIVPAAVKLDEADVPDEGRWIVLPPAAHGKLLLDSRFVKVNESGSQTLRNGVVGSAAGFTVLKSNNASQANRTGITATTVSGAKGLTAAAGTFNQGDVGMAIAGTGIGASSNKIASVGADGSTATTTVNQTASATVADIALSGGGQLVTAGSPIATAYAEQINSIEAARMEKRFADLLKGLHLYGAKVVRPSGLVVASVKTS